MRFFFSNRIKRFVTSCYAFYLMSLKRKVKIGHSVYISIDTVLEGDNFLNDGARIISSSLGSYSYVSPYSIIINAEVGRYCSIGPGCKIGLGNHPLEGYSTSPYIYNDTLFKKRREEDFQRVKIGHDCWIGADVLILGGVKVGNGVVIGAGSVVTKDIPDFAIVIGVPGKIIRYRFDEATIDWINSTCWWNFSQDKAKEILRK
ncbi:CatB-related O-acetyltransferase [Aeromonas caviae]|uniref:CatB-related O-acetyltransferase n=1 Tax=Aeromonas caviae TaxID=648 RepID=UPI0029DE386A|nr:CatB-related O-acetyltransferase [Aeromonas caviae]MDX7842883.1 CatB-related O-acetyltransferase [Aeromonas caviae]